MPADWCPETYAETGIPCELPAGHAGQHATMVPVQWTTVNQAEVAARSLEEERYDLAALEAERSHAGRRGW
jgi:hypothetical protein